MLHGSIVLTGILACGSGPPHIHIDAAAEPAVSEPSTGREPARGAAPHHPAADGFATIAVPPADCGCSRTPSGTSAASQVWTVRLVDSVALLPETRQAVADEILRFTGGRRIDVDEPARAESVGNMDAVYVLLRPGAAPAHAGPARKRAGRTDDASLAWTLFEQDRPSSLVFIWVGAVQQLLDRSSIEGRPFTRWHADLRRAWLARALGRIAAHEIGHLMCGRLHASGGLMRRRFSTDDLLWKTTWLETEDPDRTCGDGKTR